tara:strand:- start:85 stop:288 length:204 start_codon:yes stop_codon:yes gene_type:complete
MSTNDNTDLKRKLLKNIQETEELLSKLQLELKNESFDIKEEENLFSLIVNVQKKINSIDSNNFFEEE